MSADDGLIAVGEVLAWVEQQALFPLVKSSSLPNDQEVRARLRSVEGVASAHIEAMVWIRLGQIDRAHELVEHSSSGVEAYMHAIVHRIEGDYWNSKYWLRRAREPRLTELIASSLIIPPEGSNVESNAWQTWLRSENILFNGEYSPERVVDLHERVVREQSKAAEPILANLRLVESIEWRSLWDSIG